MLPDQKLNALIARHAALERDLTAAVPPETYVKLSREFAELAPVVEAVRSYRAAQRELDDLISLIADPATDPEMRSNAKCDSRSCPKMRWTSVTLYSKFVPAPVATRPLCLPAICSACTSAMPPSKAGKSKSSARARDRWAAIRRSSPKSAAAALLPS